MKRRYPVFTVTFIALMLTVGLQTLDVAEANPYGVVWPTEIPPPASVKLIVNLTSPIGNTVYTNGTVKVCFNVTLDDPNHFGGSLYMSYYKGDWMKDSAWCPFPTKSNVWYTTRFLQFNFSLSGIPFGEHTLEITPTAQGTFIRNNTAYHFGLNKTVTIKFSVLSNPIINLLSNQNLTSTNSSFPLNFRVDHPVQEITYSLDGQKSLPINGNTTLTGLANGPHNVTVSATDDSAYKGISDTLYFYVDTPESPFVPLAVALAIALITVASISLVYFKRRKGKP